MTEVGATFERMLRVGEGRRIKRIHSTAEYITTLEPDFVKLSDAELKAKTTEFRQRLENGESLDDLLPETFPAVRESRLRDSDLRMFAFLLMGCIVLHEFDIADFKSGECKTFVATLP